MFAFINSFLLILAEGAKSGGGLAAWWHETGEHLLSYPGFEAWKFLNLAIFVGVLVYLLKQPLSDGFKAKREAIRAELIKAEVEKQAALVKLTAAEAKLARVEADAAAVVEKARNEAAEETARIARETDEEIARLRKQAETEIARKSGQVRVELRRFSAEESIRLAEEKIKKNISAAQDAQLVKANIQSIGGLN